MEYVETYFWPIVLVELKSSNIHILKYEFCLKSIPPSPPVCLNLLTVIYDIAYTTPYIHNNNR